MGDDRLHRPPADGNDDPGRSGAGADPHVWILESLDRIDRVMRRSEDLEQMMRDVLDELLDLFDCDRAFLLYPCNPSAAQWRPRMERTRPEYPGAGAESGGAWMPTTDVVAKTFQIYLDAPGPVVFGPGGDHPLQHDAATLFALRTYVAMALRPRTGDAWAFGLHQCSRDRTWTGDEVRLFEEVGRRLSDGLSNLLAYRELKRTEERLQFALEAGTTGALDIDLATGTGTWTSEVATIAGLPTGFDGNLLEAWTQRIHPDDAERVAADFAAAVGEGAEHAADYRMVMPDGTVKWVRWRGRFPIDTETGSRRAVGVVVDFTETKATEARLRASELRFRRIIDTANEGIWALDATGVTTFVNARMSAILGYDAREIVGRRFASFIPEEDGHDHLVRMEARRRGVAETYDRRFVHRSGRIIWTQVSATPIMDEAGAFAGSFGMVSDITERKEAETAVAVLNARLERQVMDYRTLMEQASDAIFVADEHRRYVDVNVAACEMLGYTREELLELSIADVTPPGINPGQEVRLRRMAAGDAVLSERTLRRKDGSQLLAELSARRLADGRIQAIVRDITERKRLQAEQARLAAAVEQAGEAIVVTDPWATILYVNPAFERVSGYSRAELVGANPRVLSSGVQDGAFYRDLWSTIRQGRVWRGTFVNRTKGGTLFEEDAVISPIHDPDGRLVAFVGVKRDVTEQRRLEGQLLQTQKMQAIGQLAGGIAHDFNNLITAIRGYGEMARDGLAAGSPERADLDQVLLAADRAADLTRQLLAFGRRQVLRERVLVPADVVEGIAPMLRRLIGENITLETTSTVPDGCVRADPSQVEQVLVNLVVNARDAMPDGGTIRIETISGELPPLAPEPAGEPLVSAAEGSARPAVALRVTDTGSGMDPETLARIFEPFFTTKAPGRGTGMGLATVYGIVEQSGGVIRVTSEPGHGTSLEILFPRVERTAADTMEHAPDAEAPHGNETILVVEDEPGVREFVRRALEGFGYRVATAPDGEEALALIEAHDGPLDLLLTDVVMPRLGGFELARRARERRPGLRVLVMSGFPDEDLRAEPVDEPAWVLIGKPFSSAELALAVRGALSETVAR